MLQNESKGKDTASNPTSVYEETHPHMMRVRKRDGTLEPVDVTKIVERVTGCCYGIGHVSNTTPSPAEFLIIK